MGMQRICVSSRATAATEIHDGEKKGFGIRKSRGNGKKKKLEKTQDDHSRKRILYWQTKSRAQTKVPGQNEVIYRFYPKK